MVSKNGTLLKCPTVRPIDSLIILEQVFHLSLSHIYGIASIKNDTRGMGFNFKFKEKHNIDVFALKDFKFTIGADNFEGRILLSAGPPPKLGDPVLVSVERTGFHLSIQQIRNWLSLFGSIEGELQPLPNKDIPGCFADNYEVLMKLRKHIPSPLPAYGRKLFIRYRGQQIQCSKCMALGHTRRYCNASTNNWMEFVKGLVDQNAAPRDYFGNWFDFVQAQETILNDPAFGRSA